MSTLDKVVVDVRRNLIFGLVRGRASEYSEKKDVTLKHISQVF